MFPHSHGTACVVCVCVCVCSLQVTPTHPFFLPLFTTLFKAAEWCPVKQEKTLLSTTQLHMCSSSNLNTPQSSDFLSFVLSQTNSVYISSSHWCCWTSNNEQCDTSEKEILFMKCNFSHNLCQALTTSRQTACFKLATHSSQQVHWARSLRRASGWSRHRSPRTDQVVLPPCVSELGQQVDDRLNLTKRRFCSLVCTVAQQAHYAFRHECALWWAVTQTCIDSSSKVHKHAHK